MLRGCAAASTSWKPSTLQGTVQSQYSHSTVTAQSQRSHSTVKAQSKHSHSVATSAMWPSGGSKRTVYTGVQAD
eukprot:5033378-Pyramimonas_sp.AAC.1